MFLFLIVYKSYFQCINSCFRQYNALSTIAPSSPQSNAPVSVSVMSFDGTLLSDIPKKLPQAKSGILPNRPKGPIRASSTSSLDRIAEPSEVVKKTFLPSAGWASQVGGHLTLK